MRTKNLILSLAALIISFATAVMPAYAEDYAAYIGEVGYETLEAAIKGAKAGDTIEVKAGNHPLSTAKLTSEIAIQLPSDLTMVGEVDAEGNNTANIYDPDGIGAGVKFSARNIKISNIDFNNKGVNTNSVVLHTTGECVIENSYLSGDFYGTNYSTVSAGTLTINNCTVDGVGAYAINVGEGNGNVVVKNTKLSGWNSFGNTGTVTFENCEFYKSAAYDYLRFYQDGVIKDCTFNPDMLIDIAGEGKTLTATGNVVEGGAEFASIIEEEADVANNKIFVDGKQLGVPELPTATVTEIPAAELDANVPLTFSLQFKADAATDEQLSYYGKWYADYVITVNKDVVIGDGCTAPVDGYLAGEYENKYTTGWLKVPYGKYAPVTLKAGEGLKIMEFASKLMGEKGLKYTYAEVYNVVKKFNCGLYLNEEFIENNPDFEVTLELRMYNNVDESESYTIGETHKFTIPVKELKNACAKVEDMPLNKAGGLQMAIIAGLSSLDADSVGFEYQIGEDDIVHDFNTKTVYTALVTTDKEGKEVVIDKKFLNDGISEYVYGLLIEIASTKNYTVKWRPYTVLDGEKIYGKYRNTPFLVKDAGKYN